MYLERTTPVMESDTTTCITSLAVCKHVSLSVLLMFDSAKLTLSQTSPGFNMSAEEDF